MPDLHKTNDAPLEDWWKAFEVNVKGSFIIAQAFLNIASPGATLIGTSSAVVNFPYVPKYSSYSASKLALLGVLEDIQSDNPEFRIFSFHPGVVASDMNAKSGIPPMDEGEKMYNSGPMNNLKKHVVMIETLPAAFTVWLTTPKADFLKGRMVWCNWDVDELMAKEQEIVEQDLLKAGIKGFSAGVL